MMMVYRLTLGRGANKRFGARQVKSCLGKRSGGTLQATEAAARFKNQDKAQAKPRPPHLALTKPRHKQASVFSGAAGAVETAA